jgi:acyl transferase domain-containing protein/acyl carrier protein
MMTEQASAVQYVAAIFAEILGRTPREIDVHANFDEFQLDSVTNLNIVARMEQDTGELPATLLFEHRTVTEVADAIATRLPHPSGAGDSSQDSAAGLTGPQDVRSAYGDDDVAVIGVSGRYPGSPEVSSLWRRLVAGDVCVEEVPAERWDWRIAFAEESGRPGTTYGRWGGFLTDVDRFDAAFFKVLPNEAEQMDPQQRLFLETAWNLLEETGHLSEWTREPSTGVFVGSMYATYGQMGAGGWPQGIMTGPSAPGFSIANRVSYFFDLQGPSYTVDSACSSSLTAVHLATESLRRGECRMAIAGGVNLILHPAHLVALSSMGMLSHDGLCRVFDDRADGIVPGEGVGAVLLKPLRQAVADGDTVWAVIRSSHVNNDGRTSGYTVPNPVTQAALVSETYRRAGVDPQTISYIEAHGTGTALGDPIEIAGLQRAFGGGEHVEGSCTVGSVKANLGHLEGAAGIAGLTKVLLQLKHQTIVPTPNLETVNPKIGFAGSPFRPANALASWERPTVDVDGGRTTVPRRAGVSSFGAGGANAHVLLEEYLPQPSDAEAVRHDEHAEHLVLVSARTPGQLAELAARLAQHVTGSEAEGLTLPALAYTSQVGRSEMPERCAVVAGDLAMLADHLGAVGRGETPAGVMVGTAGSDLTATALLDDDGGRALLDALVRKRHLTKLGWLWTAGVAIDWRPMWGRAHPARVTMPPYPFDRRRYWLQTTVPQVVSERRDDSVEEGPSQTETSAESVTQGSEEAVGDDLIGVIRQLCLIACGFLMVQPDEVDVDAELMELGFDSISLTELIDRLNERYGIDLDVSVIFDAPSLAAIARYLCAEYPQQVANENSAQVSQAQGR